LFVASTASPQNISLQEKNQISPTLDFQFTILRPETQV
jgi:hypothetical protein